MKTTNTVILVLLLAVAGAAGKIKTLSGENKRLGDNQRALLSDVEFYKTDAGLNVASVEKLTLSNSEFEKYCAELAGTVESLNLKIKRLQSVSQSVTKTVYNVETTFKDSIAYSKGIDPLANDSVYLPDTLRCLSYKDNWLSFSGCEKAGKFNGHVETRDTLITIVHRVPKKFLFFRFGTKAIRQEVVSKNPYSTIEYAKYIEFK